MIVFRPSYNIRRQFILQIELILKYMYGKCILFKINVHNHTRALSLVHTVPVYAPVRSGSLEPADRGEPGRIGNELEYVHIFPAVLRTRPGLGQNLITLCPGNATVCDGSFPV